MQADPLDGRTPVTLLSGWLGAGKTTLLNRILSDPQGQRYAVLVNEFGDIGVDDRLVVRSDDSVVELSNGCVCCTVRGDLVTTLLNLQKRRPPFFRRRQFDRVLLETTGVAEPAPLLRTFLMEEQIAERFRIEALVTVVDARHAELALAEPAAEEQVALADVLLINKTDLVADSSKLQLRKQLLQRNPIASIFESIQAEVDLQEILARRKPRLEQSKKHEHHTPHQQMGSVCLRESRALDPLQTQLWLNSCAALLAGKLIRYKGFLNFDHEPNRAVLQGVYELYTVSAGEPWQKDEPRLTELVFIGRDLNKDYLRRGLEACLAN